MQAVISAIYYLLVAYVALVIARNFVSTRDVQRAILYLVVLTPFVMRILRLK